MNTMQDKSFTELKPKILEALQKIPKDVLGINESVTLVDGIFSFSFQDKYSSSTILGGPNVPSVLLVGASGQMYFFALKKLIPEL
jgi:hypothetical protein